MKTQLYKTLAYGFYIMGDIVCRVPTQITAILYQKFMNISINLDEKSGFNVWKQPIK